MKKYEQLLGNLTKEQAVSLFKLSVYSLKFDRFNFDGWDYSVRCDSSYNPSYIHQEKTQRDDNGWVVGRSFVEPEEAIVAGKSLILQSERIYVCKIKEGFILTFFSVDDKRILTFRVSYGDCDIFKANEEQALLESQIAVPVNNNKKGVRL